MLIALRRRPRTGDVADAGARRTRSASSFGTARPGPRQRRRDGVGRSAGAVRAGSASARSAAARLRARSGRARSRRRRDTRARSAVRSRRCATTLSPVMRDRGLGRHLEHARGRPRRPEARRGGRGRRPSTTASSRRSPAASAGTTSATAHRSSALRVTMPISIRTPDDPVGGNRITLIRFAGPRRRAGPRGRASREMERLCRGARDERSLPLHRRDRRNPQPLALGRRRRHAQARRLRGERRARASRSPCTSPAPALERYVAFGPTIGTAVNLTLLSYNGACCVGVTIDNAAVPDPDVLVECLRDGFEEVLDLAGDHEAVRLPLQKEWDPPAAEPTWSA